MVISIALYYFFDNGRGEGGGGLGWTGGSSVEEGVGLSLDFKQVLQVIFCHAIFMGLFLLKLPTAFTYHSKSLKPVFSEFRAFPNFTKIEWNVLVPSYSATHS